MGIYARRRLVNRVVMSLSVAATAFGLLWLVLVLWTLLENGIAAITPALFSQMTPPPGSAGGLLNAIFGSLVMTLIATLIGTPTGILVGTFLAEYSRGGRFGDAVLKLVPKTATAAYRYLLFIVDPKSGLVRSTVIYNQDGGTNHLNFTGVETNRGVDEGKFKFSPPQGTKILSGGRTP